MKFLKWSKSQIIIYLLSCIVFSLGAKLFIDAKLGTDPLDVLVLGIVGHTGLTIGIVSGAIAILFLLIWSAWNWKFPPITPFVTMFLVGNLIDLWNLLRIERFTTAILPSYLMLFLALILTSYGSALIIMSGIGIRIMDLVALTIVDKWKWKFFCAKMLLEVGFVISGWILGGPVGVGSIAFVCIVGPCIEPFINMNGKVFNIPNYGFAQKQVSA